MEPNNTENTTDQPWSTMHPINPEDVTYEDDRIGGITGWWCRPAGAVVLSPLTDLTLTGESWQIRAAADPFFTHPQVEGLVQAYIGAQDPRDPKASPLYANLTGLPPIRIHVGDDEVLLDDSRRYAAKAVAAGVDAKIDIWLGMPHVFPSNTGQLTAANQALTAIGTLLLQRLNS